MFQVVFYADYAVMFFKLLMIWCKDKLESSFEFICSVVWPTLMKCLFMISAMFLGSVISEPFSDRQMSVSP